MNKTGTVHQVRRRRRREVRHRLADLADSSMADVDVASVADAVDSLRPTKRRRRHTSPPCTRLAACAIAKSAVRGAPRRRTTQWRTWAWSTAGDALAPDSAKQCRRTGAALPRVTRLCWRATLRMEPVETLMKGFEQPSMLVPKSGASADPGGGSSMKLRASLRGCHARRDETLLAGCSGNGAPAQTLAKGFGQPTMFVPPGGAGGGARARPGASLRAPTGHMR